MQPKGIKDNWTTTTFSMQAIHSARISATAISIHLCIPLAGTKNLRHGQFARSMYGWRGDDARPQRFKNDSFGASCKDGIYSTEKASGSWTGVWGRWQLWERKGVSCVLAPLRIRDVPSGWYVRLLTVIFYGICILKWTNWQLRNYIHNRTKVLAAIHERDLSISREEHQKIRAILRSGRETIVKVTPYALRRNTPGHDQRFASDMFTSLAGVCALARAYYSQISIVKGQTIPPKRKMSSTHALSE